MERGKLKIFFGYSAGVGKTYSMLKVAHELISEGVDIVIGYVEPHDRLETIKMTEGIECIPLKNIKYNGINLTEFDVDTAILRRPNIMLIDELAHTNAVGSKNSKRYIDVLELLNSGIDVWTTVNVQHIEGLHDVIDDMTCVDVNERVPDEVFDYAEEVVLVDIEPLELIERMISGKIYKKTHAINALENFFKSDNLSSLREIAMRRSADRIEKQANNGALKTKILVLISPSPSSEKNIRVAARMAEVSHSKFAAIYIEKNTMLSIKAETMLKKHMRIVRELHGNMIVKYDYDIVEAVANFVKIEGITLLIIGKTWQSIGRKVGLEDKMIARMPNIEILIVPDSEGFQEKKNWLKLIKNNIVSTRKKHFNHHEINMTLDVIHSLTKRALENTELSEKSIAVVLACAFERSCIVMCDSEYAVLKNEEDRSIFYNEKELAVSAWVKQNKKTAGFGTDTLRLSNAIYFPIIIGDKTVVIGFSCMKNDMPIADKFVLYEVENVLKMILTKKHN